MDKLAADLLSLLREMLAVQQRLLAIALARQDAMRTYDIERLNAVAAQERTETDRADLLEGQRNEIVARIRHELGRAGSPAVAPTAAEIAKRCPEPLKTQLLTLAAQLKAVVEELDRHTRINARVSEAVVRTMARVLKIVTGVAQHAGLYMRNGRKAAVAGVHLLEVTA